MSHTCTKCYGTRVLSIGKLRNDAVRTDAEGKRIPGKRAGAYYVESVARGHEDYYLGRGEAPGRWIGGGCWSLDVAGEVADEGFLRMLEGRDPATGKLLIARPRNGERTPGFDLTFSAPKSVSVLWGLTGESVSDQVREAHDAAVAEAVSFLERRVAFTRRGHTGATRIDTTGLVVAAFRHRCSRAGDPALHTHCVVPNLVRGADGRWSALDARLIYAWGKTAGYLYQAALRRELVERLGVAWTDVHRGTAEVEGVPADVCRLFSKRREEILQRLEERGESTAKAAQAATLDTRHKKDYGVDGATLQERWRSQARHLRVTAADLETAAGRDRLRALDDRGVSAIRERLASAGGLTQRASTFGLREVIQGWCDQLRQGARAVDVVKEASAFVADAHHAVLLGRAEELRSSDVIRREDGSVVAVDTDEHRYSTPELLATEKALITAAMSRQNAGVGRASGGAVARAITERPYLSDEQATMVRTVAGGGEGVVIVVGRPGSGKTTALGACREAWEASGLRVVGCALAAETARVLESESGIASSTVTQLLADIADPLNGGLAAGTVIVVDEASMVGTRQLQPLLETAGSAGAKVVLVGDDGQLPEIDAGGAFRGLRQRVATAELTDNRRQRQVWEREALELLRGGETTRALAEYQSREAVIVGETATQVRQQLVHDWWAARRAGEEPVMIAARNADVDRLNGEARALRVAAGELTGPALDVSGRRFAMGDRIVAMKNAPRIGVRNGTRAVVTGVDELRGELHARTDDGIDVRLPRDYIARRIRHAYALTGHKAQGKTVSRAFVLADEGTYREWAYMAMSRGADENRVYLVHREAASVDDTTHGTAPAPDVLDGVARGMQRSAAKTMAVDTGSQGQVSIEELAAEVAEIRRRVTESLRQRRRDQVSEQGIAQRSEPDSQRNSRHERE